MLVQQHLQSAFLVRIEDLGAAAHELSADEDLRNRIDRGARAQRCPDLSTPVALLVLDGVEINRTVCNALLREQPANRPTELAPLEREHHHRLRRIRDCARYKRLGIGCDWLARARRLRRGRSPGEGKTKVLR